MHKLLEQQLKKHFPQYTDFEEINDLLDVVSESYVYYDKSRDRVDRAMFISSAELVRNNEKLREEGEKQKVLLSKLQGIMETLRPQKQLKNGKKIEESNIELVEELSKVVERQKSHEKGTERLLADLTVANKELDSFAHIISHDLKALLRGISSITTWIQEDFGDKLGSEGLEQIELLKQRTQKMYDLIAGVLEYSRLGRSSVSRTKVNLNKLLKSDVLPLLVIPEHVNIKISDLPEIVGDKYLIQQLFQNLIDNAIKFSDKVKAEVVINCTDSVSHWQFLVKDNGIGIDEKYHDKVFKIFQTLS